MNRKYTPIKTRKTKWDLTARERNLLTYVVMLSSASGWRNDYEIARTFTLEDADAIMSTYDENTTYIIKL